MNGSSPSVRRGRRPAFAMAINLMQVLSQPRQLLVLASWLFAAAIHFAHVTYLYPIWEYYGFTLTPLGTTEFFLIAALVTCGALFMPKTIDSASAVVLLMLYVVVYVPAIVITLSLDTNRLERYLVSLLMLAIAFGISGMAARAKPRMSPRTRPPDARFIRAVLIGWLILCALLITAYLPIMTFSGLDDIYDQRAAGASTSIWMGYAQTYFGNVLSPALIALGLTRSRLRWVLIGTTGCVIIYMINAQRTIFLLPIAMIGLDRLLTSKRPFLRTTAFPMLLLAALVVWATIFIDDNVVASILALFLVFRTLSIPGLTFSQYHDLFASEGYTWWSHIKGLDFFIPPPALLAKDPSWPGLGYIVGDRVYSNVENNVNANLFSGDGLAAAGPFGVVVIGLVFAIWLIALNRATRGWDARFSTLIALPLGLALTNGHFFTTMLSFGGIFWLLVFHFYKPASGATRKVRKAWHRAAVREATPVP